MVIRRKSFRFSVVLTAVAASALGAYFVAAQVASPPPPGITAEVQAELHMTKPTHDTPTGWGEFLIVPQAAPTEQRADVPSVRPEFGPAANRVGFAGPNAPAQVASQVASFVDLPPEFHSLAQSKGMSIAEASAEEEASGSFRSSILYLRTNPSAMLNLSAYTPTGPVQITEFPDTAIYDFRTSISVNGKPTITKFPDKGTSDPNGDREVMWSQNGAVYFLKTFGPFSDDDVLRLASQVSISQEAKP